MAEREDEFEDDEPPMNEEQWAEFIRRAEARSDRYGELFETLLDDPQREQKIAKEMGWRIPDEALGDDVVEDVPFEPDAADDEPSASEDFDFDEPDEEDSIPAYRMINELGKRADAVLHPLMEQDRGKGEEAVGEDLSEAYIQVHIASAKIAGGHGMGYEDDVLCGNIVCNRIALEALGKCDAAWRRLAAGRIVPQDAAAAILAELARCIAALEQRIAELRKSVWW
jgi:hypothetical protein